MRVQESHKCDAIRIQPNGEVLISFDFKPYESESGTELWECERVTTYLPLTSNKIKQAVIADRWHEDKELKIINTYNAGQLGLLTQAEKEKAIADYKTFLAERAELLAKVDEMLKDYPDIPNE